MAYNIIPGADLMLFVGGKSVGHATNHTLSITTETTDISSKDIAAGKWTAAKAVRSSWEATTENLYSLTWAKGNMYGDLFDMIGTEVALVFSLSSTADEDGEIAGVADAPTGGWTPGSKPYLVGNAVITSLELNAPNGDNATFTATFTGTGALTKGTPAGGASIVLPQSAQTKATSKVASEDK